MASMDSRLILAGQQPNFLNTIATANQAAAQQNQFQQQNALRDFNRENGAAVLAGDQNALNGYAGIAGPEAALGIQSTRQAMDINQEELGMRRETAKRQAIAWGQTQDDRTKALEAEKMRKGLMIAGAAYEAGDQARLDQIMKQYNLEPVPLAEFPYVAAGVTGGIEGLTAASQFGKPPAPDYGVTDGQFYDKNNPGAGAQPIPGMVQDGPKPQSTAGKIAFDLKQGLITEEQAAAALAPKGMSIESDGKGGFKFVQGAGAGKDPTDTSNPSSPAAMIASIDGILSDPALDKSTGMLAWTQGIPGTDQRRFGARVKQLDGQAFLQAFESLKGGGQITEIEGAKATQAIGRLDSGQEPGDYRQALIELKDILSLAAGRPVGWAQQQSATPAEMPTISGNIGYDALPSGTVFIAPDGTQRRKP